MVRLKDIPEETLKEIEKFIKENSDKYPVWNDAEENLVKLIEKKFGYRLSPSQVYALRKGEKIYRIKLDIEAIRALEEEFGSVSAGIKKLLKYYKTIQLPPDLKKYHKALLNKGKELSPDEIVETLRPLCEDESKIWKIIGELRKRGYIDRDRKGKYIIHEIGLDPMLQIALMFGH